MNRRKQYKDQDKARETIRKQNLKYYGRTTNAINSRQRWTVRELDIVMEHSMTDREISALIGRSVKAIQLLRCRENKKRKKVDENA